MTVKPLSAGPGMRIQGRQRQAYVANTSSINGLYRSANFSKQERAFARWDSSIGNDRKRSPRLQSSMPSSSNSMCKSGLSDRHPAVISDGLFVGSREKWMAIMEPMPWAR